MANIQHIYDGDGDPNLNPALTLQGAAIGVHLYLDNLTGDVWMSTFIVTEGVKTHEKWRMITLLPYDR